METAALSPSSHDEATAALPTSKDAPTTTAHALTPPTSEDMNHKVEDGSSDLSDLDLDEEEDGEEIFPDHYYDGGKVPVFKPTMDQFRDFKKFIDKIDKYGMKSGIVKVVPPQEWRQSLPALDELVKSIRIKNPIMQEFMGTHGTYTQANIEKQRSYNLPEWKTLTEEPSNQPPARRGERRRNQEKVVRGGGSLRGRGAAKPAEAKQAGPKRKPGRPRRNPLPTTEENESGDESSQTTRTQVPPTPTSPKSKPNDGKDQSDTEKVDPTPTKRPRGRPAKGTQTKAAKPRGPPKGGQQKSVTSRRMNNRTEAVDWVDEKAFGDFNYHMDHLDEFTPDRCAELETAYWKSLTFAQPMYAADMPGSLFPDDITTWNVAKLPNLLDVLGTKVPGVNTAYLYMGMWKATFAWHLEDVDLYSINYIHFGAPKQWYSISQEDARRFEAAMRSVWPNDSKHCDQFLRHKTYLISPQLLESKFNIKVNKLVHHEGEFVITYPYGYHSGYNLGYNCAESVNFANEAWLDYGRIARKCECEADSVWVDVADIERKLRGEPTPEYYEETDDEDDEMEEETGDLPSPPASVAGKTKAQPRKRKRDVKEKDAGKKKKRIRIRVKAPTREPCILCPNDAPYEPLLPTDNGRKAHRSCALYTPETWVHTENGVEKVFGVTGIDRARLELKCNFCRSKRGACFQCASKKCTRAFHATCAAAAGVQIDAGPVPTFGEDGTEYYEEGYDFRCRFHRPKRAKNLDVDGLENSKLINNYAKTLKPNDVVQMQLPQGDVFAGLVIENRPSEASLLVEILPEGDRVEVEWKWIVVLDPVDSLRPKPSSNAIPMPEGMNKKSVSIDNRQDGIPKMEEPFHDSPAFKWQEFVNIEMPPNGYAVGSIKNKEQVKINMDAPDSLYYYLPKLSSEARCKFTDDPKGQYPVAKADFMDRVRPQVQHNHANQYTYRGPMGTPRANIHAFNAVQRPLQANERPYVYKPKLPAAPQVPYGVDPRAYAQQQAYQEAHRRASQSVNPAGTQMPPLRQQSSDSSQNGLRPFPGDVYYSAPVLPAAFPGEYSAFTKYRRQSSSGSSSGYIHQPYGAQSQPRRPGDYAQFPSTDRRLSTQASAPLGPAPNIGNGSAGSSNAPLLNSDHRDANSTHRPASSHCHPPAGAEAQVAPQQGPPADSRYSSFPPIDTRTKDPPPVSKTLPNLPAPSTAPPSDLDSRQANGDWTPPSRLYPSNPAYQTPPPQSQPVRRQQPTYQTADEFQQQLGQAAASRPSNNVANRNGAFDRMMRDMTTTFPPHPPQGQGQAQAQAMDGYSPKAPTPSPLSEAATPGLRAGVSPKTTAAALAGQAAAPQWGTLSRPQVMPWQQQQQQQQQQPPTAPVQGGNETWRWS